MSRRIFSKRSHEPPRPPMTIAQLQRQDPLAWQVLQHMLAKWIDEVIPGRIPGDFGARMLPGLLPALDGDIDGEAKLEAVEHLYDLGYLRLKVTNRSRDKVIYCVQAWNGHDYQMVGRDH